MCDFGVVSGPLAATAIAGSAAGISAGAAGAATIGSGLSLGTILSGASIASTVLGTGMQILGGIQGGRAANAQAQYAAQVAETNQKIALNNRTIAARNIEIAQRNQQAAYDAAESEKRIAGEAETRGGIEAQKARDAARKLIGRQRAVLAANGVVVDEGSALDVTTDTAALGKMDELFILGNAEREASGFRQRAKNFVTQGENFGVEAEKFALEGGNMGAQASTFANEAVFNRSTGASAQSSSLLGAAGTFASGVGSVASKWYNATRKTPTYGTVDI